MSVGEMVGLMLTALVLGGVVGGLMTSSFRPNAPAATRRIDAYAQWLAARMTLTRASASFIMAFKVLAAEPRNATYYTLRQDEAQRARAAWCDATRELDRAEALLIVWSRQPDIRARLASFDRVAPEVLRATINGDPRDVKHLLDRLRTADGDAADFAIEAVDGGPSVPILRHWVKRAMACFQSIERQWNRP